MPKFKYIVIVGCGRLGSALANKLSRLGNSVVVIDRQSSSFVKLSSEFSGFQVEGDAMELSTLTQAQVQKADCFLAATDNDNVNLTVAQIARTLFHVPTVMARIFDPAREDVYRQFGIETICPTTLSSEAFLHALQAQSAEEIK
jgi:trk system potassium uptake protein TrkA